MRAFILPILLIAAAIGGAFAQCTTECSSFIPWMPPAHVNLTVPTSGEFTVVCPAGQCLYLRVVLETMQNVRIEGNGGAITVIDGGFQGNLFISSTVVKSVGLPQLPAGTIWIRQTNPLAADFGISTQVTFDDSCPCDSWEPNYFWTTPKKANDLGTLQPGELNVSASLCPAGDEDNYVVKLESTQSVVIRVTYAVLQTPIVTWRSALSTTEQQASVTGGNWAELTVNNAPNGTYYIRLHTSVPKTLYTMSITVGGTQTPLTMLPNDCGTDSTSASSQVTTTAARAVSTSTQALASSTTSAHASTTRGASTLARASSIASSTAAAASTTAARMGTTASQAASETSTSAARVASTGAAATNAATTTAARVASTGEAAANAATTTVARAASTVNAATTTAERAVSTGAQAASSSTTRVSAATTTAARATTTAARAATTGATAATSAANSASTTTTTLEGALTGKLSTLSTTAFGTAGASVLTMPVFLIAATAVLFMLQ